MKTIKSVTVLGFLALASVACFDLFSPSCVGDGCNATATKSSNQQPSPSPIQSPNPSPSPSASLNPCQADAIVASLAGGSQPNEIKVTEEPKRLDATAFGPQGEITQGCNLTRFPVWEVRTPGTCVVLGSGWNPFIDGTAVGSCEVRACLRQKGDGACFATPLPGETFPVTSPVLQVSVK